MAYISFQPSDFFNTVLYTGNGSTQSITGVGFQPDFVWLKDRVLTYDHQLHDSNRGASAGYLASNNTNSENPTYPLTSFDSDGWTTVSGGTPGQNASGDTFVSWNWKANGGTTSSNTDGSITSTVQANTTAGFSVITFTSSNTPTQTFGHGLSQAPKFFIVKNRSTGNWTAYHSSLGATKYIRLNLTDASTSSSTFWNDTAPSSSVITLGSAYQAVANLLCYAFAEIKGYSKFGSYTGNGSTNGTYVYTGFRPAFVMTKRTNAIGPWNMKDTKRPGYNDTDDSLFADSSAVEDTRGFDILSNGFKLRNSGTEMNGGGSTYVYMAFAEFPVVGSNGTAGTAR